MPSVFTRIINRELPAKIFYETDDVIVIADHRPRDTIHLMIIPKCEYSDFYHTPPEVLTLLDATVKIVADKLGLSDHFRIVVNNGYGQEIDHLHYHFLSNLPSDKLVYISD